MALDEEFAAGLYLPKVYIIDEGYIPNNETLVPTEITIELMSCSPEVGSRAGGFEITIEGKHLGYDLEEETTSVTMGDKDMEIVSLE